MAHPDYDENHREQKREPVTAYALFTKMCYEDESANIDIALCFPTTPCSEHNIFVTVKSYDRHGTQLDEDVQMICP